MLKNADVFRRKPTKKKNKLIMKHICVVSFFRHDIHSFFLSVDVWLQFQFHWPVHFIATIFNIIWSGSSAFLLMINRRILISAFFFFHRCVGPGFKLWRQRIMIIWEEEFHEMRSNRLRNEKKTSCKMMQNLVCVCG